MSPQGLDEAFFSLSVFLCDTQPQKNAERTHETQHLATVAAGIFLPFCPQSLHMPTHTEQNLSRDTVSVGELG